MSLVPSGISGSPGYLTLPERSRQACRVDRNSNSTVGFSGRKLASEKSRRACRTGENSDPDVRFRGKKLANMKFGHSISAIRVSDSLVSTSPVNDSSTNFYDFCPLVKMCGITTPEDAALAARAGANYVGMIIWPHSKRSVSLTAAKEIVSAAREYGAEPVGVFVSESAREIEEACEAAGFSFAQLHGDGARASLLQLPRSLRTIYVMQADANGCLQTAISTEEEKLIDWILVDGLEGGSGSKFAWGNFEVPSLFRNKGWLLAGGLTPENVGTAISTLRPNAVDVASGIAGPDGIGKDPSRVLAFMQAITAATGPASGPV